MSTTKKHDATPRKLERVREEGQIAPRQGLVRALVLVSLVEGVIVSADWWWSATRRIAEACIEYGVDPAGRLDLVLAEGALAAVIAIAAISGGAAFVAVGSGLLLNGFLLAPKVLTPRFQRLDPVANLKAKFGARGFAIFAITVLKLTLFLGAAALLVRASLPVLAASWRAPDHAIATAIGSVVLPVVRSAEAVFVIMSLIEAAVERYQFMRSQRMDDTEMKQEYREQSGDPYQRAVRRALARADLESTMQATGASDPDVLLANPTHFVVGLAYRRGEDIAPRVVEKCRDGDALQAIARARSRGTAVIRSPAFTRSLFAASSLGQPVPPAFYTPIAVVYRLLEELESEAAGGVIDVPSELLTESAPAAPSDPEAPLNPSDSLPKTS